MSPTRPTLTLRSPPALVLALAACAATSGCAPWQVGTGPDALAAALDEGALALDDRLIVRLVGALGEGTAAPDAKMQAEAFRGEARMASSDEAVLASYDDAVLAEPPMPATELDEPLSPPAPAPAPAARLTSNAAPISTAPAVPATAATSAPVAAKSCTCDACTGAVDEDPVAAIACPLYCTCGRCVGGVMDGCRAKLFTRPEPGPPPIRFRPLLPPKFLPVPTQPTLSPARPDAPEPWRGDIEVGWRAQLTFPARD